MGMHGGPGALVVRWSRARMIEKVLHSHGFAVQCMRLVLSQAIIDQLFSAALPRAHASCYKKLARTRRSLNMAPLAPEAAMQNRTPRRQFLMSHVSFRDFWEPSPHQRVVNAVTTG